MVQVRQFYLPGCDLGIALGALRDDRESVAVGALQIFDAFPVDRVLRREFGFENLFHDSGRALAKALCIDRSHGGLRRERDRQTENERKREAQFHLWLPACNSTLCDGGVSCWDDSVICRLRSSRCSPRALAALRLLLASVATRVHNHGRRVTNSAKLAVRKRPCASMKRAMHGISKFDSSEITLTAPNLMPCALAAAATPAASMSTA